MSSNSVGDARPEAARRRPRRIGNFMSPTVTFALPRLRIRVTYNDMNSAESPSRPYRSRIRSDAAQATGERILDAFAEQMRRHWFDEITLESVADAAGVTVRTVIRRFGGKDGLLTHFVDRFGQQVNMQCEAVPGDIDAALTQLLDFYEEWGDSVIRNLAQEPRHPALKPLLDDGRRAHRDLTALAFGPTLATLPEPERRRATDALVIATDVYTWKLLRRDMGRTRPETAIVVRRLVDAVLAQLSAQASDFGESR